MIPASWLDANRTDVLKAIEEGMRQAAAEYAHAFPYFDAAVTKGTEEAVATYARSIPDFDGAVATGTEVAVADYARLNPASFSTAVGDGAARGVGGAA